MILGIDPGLYGAFALFNPATRRIERAQNIPTLEAIRNGKECLKINFSAIWLLLKEWRGQVSHVFLEQVTAVQRTGEKRQGLASTAEFIGGARAVEMAVICAELPITRVTAAQWKRALKAPADKDAAIVRANELLPSNTGLWTPKRSVITKKECSGIAEASMIALFGAQQISY